MVIIGWHINKNGDFVKSIENELNELNRVRTPNTPITIQIFTHGPRSYLSNFKEGDAQKLTNYTRKNLINILVHSTYFCSAVYKESGYAKTIEHIRQQLIVCDSLNSVGFVIHMTKSVKDIHIISNTLIKIIKLGFKTPIIVENDSVKPVNDNGDRLDYGSPDDIDQLIKNVCKGLTKEERKKFGVCIDTSHLHATGQNLSNYDLAYNWCNQITKTQYIRFIHLNDNTNTRGSSLDKHDHINEGHVFLSPNTPLSSSGCKAFVEFANLYDIPIILERHPEKNENIEDYKKAFTKELNYIVSCIKK